MGRKRAHTSWCAVFIRTTSPRNTCGFQWLQRAMNIGSGSSHAFLRYYMYIAIATKVVYIHTHTRQFNSAEKWACFFAGIIYHKDKKTFQKMFPSFLTHVLVEVINNLTQHSLLYTTECYQTLVGFLGISRMQVNGQVVGGGEIESDKWGTLDILETGYGKQRRGRTVCNNYLHSPFISVCNT